MAYELLPGGNAKMLFEREEGKLPKEIYTDILEEIKKRMLDEKSRTS